MRFRFKNWRRTVSRSRLVRAAVQKPEQAQVDRLLTIGSAESERISEFKRIIFPDKFVHFTNNEELDCTVRNEKSASGKITYSVVSQHSLLTFRQRCA
jgi:hypothetical protein